MNFTITRKKIVSGFLVLCLAFMTLLMIPETVASAKTKEKKIEITNPVTALTVGSTYTLKANVTPANKNEKITWKTSDSKIAKVDAKGKVTAKKVGDVTITASIASGEKATCVISIVSWDGMTDSEFVFNQMLQSTQVKRISLRQLEQNVDYVVKEGDYSDRTLKLNIPKSHFENYGLFKYITIEGIGDDTYYEYAKGNQIYIKDRNADVKVMNDASVKVMKDYSNKATLNLEVLGSLEKLELTGVLLTVNINGTGEVKKIVVSKYAKGCELNLECPSTISMSTNGNIIVKPGAEGTIIELSTGKENVTIENLSSEDVIVKNKKTGKETIIPGIPVVTQKLEGQVSSDGKEVTYTLPVKLSELKNIDVTYRELVTMKLGVNSLILFNNMLSAEEQYMLVWYRLSKLEIMKNQLPIKVYGEANSWTKTVSLAGVEFEVTVNNEAKTATVKRKGSSNEYVFSKISDTQLKISCATSSNVAELISLTVTY